MKNIRIEVKNDLFNISGRIRKIDRDYAVYFNKKTRNYEVWRHHTLSFVVGKTLDNFALLKSHKTNIRNARDLFRDMNEHNKNLEEKEVGEIEQNKKTLLSRLLNYADKKSCDLDFENIDNTKWY